MTLTLFVPGKPFGKQRYKPIQGRRGVTPEKTVNYESLVVWGWIKKNKNRIIEASGYKFEIIACFLPPAGASAEKKKAMLSGEILCTSGRNADFDNMAKICSDALNGIAYIDDKFIVIGSQIKLYRPYQGVLIRLSTVDKIEPKLIEWVDREIEKEGI